MTKPHDERWEVDEEYLRGHGETLVVTRPDGWTVCSVDGREHDYAEAEHRGRLIAAAPAMARALLALFGDAEHATFCPALTRPGRLCQIDCENARAALREAGVLE